MKHNLTGYMTRLKLATDTYSEMRKHRKELEEWVLAQTDEKAQQEAVNELQEMRKREADALKEVNKVIEEGRIVGIVQTNPRRGRKSGNN